MPHLRPKWPKLISYLWPNPSIGAAQRTAHTYIAHIKEYTPTPVPQEKVPRVSV